MLISFKLFKDLISNGESLLNIINWIPSQEKLIKSHNWDLENIICDIYTDKVFDFLCKDCKSLLYCNYDVLSINKIQNWVLLNKVNTCQEIIIKNILL